MGDLTTWTLSGVLCALGLLSWLLARVERRRGLERAEAPAPGPVPQGGCRLLWDRRDLPLTVLPPPPAARGAAGALRRAIAHWNRLAGFQLVTPLGSQGLGRRVPVRAAALEGGAPFTVLLKVDGSGTAVDVEVWVDPRSLGHLADGELFCAAVRALGELLGVPHGPRQEEASAAQRAFLRRAYGRPEEF